MDPRLLRYYNSELQHIREMSGEFARQYPKIAGRLGLDTFEVADPYVERLIEGFAFLAARVQLKVDSEFPRFTNAMFEAIYPHYLAPTPSMAVVRMQPDLGNNALAPGFLVPRGAMLRSLLGKGEQTPCDFRTAQDVKLWPLDLAEAEYLPTTGAIAAIGVTDLKGVKAAIRLRFRATAGLNIDALAIDSLPIFLRGLDITPVRLYEALVAQSAAVVVRPTARPIPWVETLRQGAIRQRGFSFAEALLPYEAQSFHGYRLLHEYFAMPQRFLFVELAGLAGAFARCKHPDIDVIILLRQAFGVLENAISPLNFDLFCTPAINLFPKRADRIHVTDKSDEYHVVPDRTAPMDYEVYQVRSVTGYGTEEAEERDFLPFYSSTDLHLAQDKEAYFAVHREKRLLSTRQRGRGPRSSYIGSEVFVALVDTEEAPFAHDLRQLGIETLCTNRDLPLEMPVGKADTDFTLLIGAPVTSIRCVAGPTKPRPSIAEGETAWELINHLSLNYLSLADSEAGQGATALRDLLGLYGDIAEPATRRQIDGVRSVTAKPVIRRLPSHDPDDPKDRPRFLGPITYGQGVEITVTLDEHSFEGLGVFLLGAVLDRFFAKYVSINSFTETVIATVDGGEVMRWPARIGRRHLL